MDGTVGGAYQTAASGAAPPAWQPSVVDPASALIAGIEGLSLSRIDDAEALVLTKTVPGFDAATVAALRKLVAEAGAGRLGRLKFLVFDFAHSGFPLSLAGDDFDLLATEVANLILAAPVVSVASIRANMAGADLEFALACSIMVGEAPRRFSFAADPTVSIATYGLLAQKIGFVRAERLMEKGDILDAAQMQELLLLKDVAEEGLAGVEAFLRKTVRRHNACCGIYRAQRIAARPVHESLRAS